MAEGEPLAVGRVFVPGGLPTVTYNPRPELNLEQQVEDYLSERHRILSVSGPTKTGKTVLLRSIVKDAIWLSGGAIQTAQDFWTSVADALGLFTEQESVRTQTDAEGRGWRVGGGIKLVEGEREGSSSTSTAREDRLARTRPVSSIAKEHLRTGLHPVVIDDFHYIPAHVQTELVRALKDVVFDGCPVIVAAVPHRAYDVVRVEKEMTGRVQQLQVGFWSTDELFGIARTGFRALGLVDEDEALTDRLARECFQSPHLMQDFCLELCKANGIRVAPTSATRLNAPEWKTFFQARSSATSKAAFDLLARGPRQRSDRKIRMLRDGSETDIYGAVLAGIAKTGPLTTLTYEELRAALRDVMSSDAPQRHEVTRVLEEMAKIAREQIEGEPVVDYDEELATLYISDPFFAYFLRWGMRDA